MDNPLKPVVRAWTEKIRTAVDVKKKLFQDDADEAMAFYDGPYDFLYGDRYARKSPGFVLRGDDASPKTTFGMTVNKVAELVQIFGPALYNRNPVRKVTPRRAPDPPFDLLGDPNDPAAQQQAVMLLQATNQSRTLDKSRAALLESYLNATPEMLRLRDHSRASVDEALIKGRGVWWTELYKPYGSSYTLAGSFHDSVDNLVIDPDAESLGDAKWVARRCAHPVWEVEREYGLEPGSLKAGLSSYAGQAEAEASPDGGYLQAQGRTNDLVVYWKVFSKMGVGGRLSGGPTGELKAALDDFGDFTYLVVADAADYPLNLPPEVFDDAASWEPGPQGEPPAVFSRLEWPTPFWADDAWPFVELDFHPVPRRCWPMSHIKPALGELKFLQWAYSFLAGKIRTTSRDFIAVRKSAAEELKTAILSGTDLELLEIEATHGTIKEVVEFLQHPGMNADIWKVIEAVEANFEKRVGLTELSYGMSTVQLRSAAEAAAKTEQLKVRPEEMQNRVEEAMSRVARAEAICARWHLTGQDVKPVLGDAGAYFWDQVVASGDLAEVVHELEYRIEEGSARRPNKERDAAVMNTALQTLMPVLQGYTGATGDVGPINNLIEDWAKTVDIDGKRYALKPPPMPAMPPGPGGPPPGPQGPPPAKPGGPAR